MQWCLRSGFDEKGIKHLERKSAQILVVQHAIFVNSIVKLLSSLRSLPYKGNFILFLIFLRFFLFSRVTLYDHLGL